VARTIASAHEPKRESVRRRLLTRERERETDEHQHTEPSKMQLVLEVNVTLPKSANDLPAVETVKLTW